MLAASPAGLSGVLPSAAADSLFFFGDSLTDEGRVGRTAPIIWAEEVRDILGLHSGVNYAMGGAYTGSEFQSYSVLDQINEFIGDGGATTPAAVAGLWIGINNIQVGAVRGVDATTIVDDAVGDVRTGMNQLVSAGISGFDLLGVFDMSLTNVYMPYGSDSVAMRATAAMASERYNAELQALTVGGASVSFYNIANYVNYMMTNPAAFGFTRVLPLLPGETCDATCQDTSVFSDIIHLSSKAQQLIGDYVASGSATYNSSTFVYGAIAANAQSAIAGVPVGSYLARAEMAAMVGSTVSRLDSAAWSRRVKSGFGDASPASGSDWSMFSSLDGNVGRDDNGSGLSGVDSALAGLTLGAEWRASDDLRLGGLVRYSHSRSDLVSVSGVDTTLDNVEAAVFAGWDTGRFFLQGVAGVGVGYVDQSRSGTFGDASSDTTGLSYVMAARGGYRFETGPIESGPVAGLTFAGSSMDGYDEKGSPLSTIRAGSQDSESLVGIVGYQFGPAPALDWPVHPVLTVTYEKEFLDSAKAIDARYLYLPTQTLPVSSIVGADAVRVALSADYGFGNGFSLRASANALKPFNDSISYGLNVGVDYAF
jgi:uncharacterized protein YhjY with autotransporter beta-barrel domain/phospholipase/lecithinase/hemolysin